MPNSLLNRLKGYSRWVQWRYNQLRAKLAVQKEHWDFEKWLSEFKSSNAQVMLGANFNSSGGVRNHIKAIAEHSELDIFLAPSDKYLFTCGTSPFTTNFTKFLATSPPSNITSVHTHVLPWLIDWAKKHRSEKLRWIHTHHAFYFPNPNQLELEPWQAELNSVVLEALGSCDVPLCVSKWQKRYIWDKFGIECFFLPNGVNVKKCDSASHDKFLSKFRLDKNFILWVGNLDQVKNPIDFVRASSRMTDRHFVMIGGPTSEKLESQGIQCPTNLTILPPLPHADIMNALAACKLLVVTSHREGLPTLVLEAMTLCKPIVIPDEAGCMDATYGDTHATVYKSQNIESLLLAIENTLPQTIRPDSRVRILEEFDWRVVCKKLDRLYKGESPKEVCG